MPDYETKPALTRRRFLSGLAKLAGGFGGAAMLGALPLRYTAAQAADFCDDWGALPDPSAGGLPVGNTAQWTCADQGGYKILEVWLDGGPSHWETFWYPYGIGTDEQLLAHSYNQLPFDQIDWTAGATPDDPCDAAGIPGSSDERASLGQSANAHEIFWGPAAKPLWVRDDILQRSRVVTLSHELGPHNAALAYGLSGLRLGNQRRAGMGVAIQRRDLAIRPDSQLPASYIVSGVPRVINAATVTGNHPAFARPLAISLGSSSFADQLARAHVSEASDGLYDALRSQYTDRMRWDGAGEVVRSPGFESYRFASEMLRNTAGLESIFRPELMTIDTSAALCPRIEGQGFNVLPHLQSEIQLGATLLAEGHARYVCVMDYGFVASHDTHDDDFLLDTSGNLLEVSRRIASAIKGPANPDGLIDLDDTLVIINAEFGRDPMIDGSQSRNHWPYGYTVVMIGGPITAATPPIHGGFSQEGFALPEFAFSPTDLRGALLLAAGVDPFAPDNFRVDDFSAALRLNSITEAEIRNRLVEVFFAI